MALYKTLGIQTVKDLKYACLTGKVACISDFGEKSQAKILEKLCHLESSDRVSFNEAKKQAETILTQLRKQTQVVRAEIAGSLRRKNKTIGDIDIIAAVTNLEKVAACFAKLPQIQSIIACGPSKISIHLKSGRQCDLRLVAPAQFGAAWLYFTGSKSHNVELRKITRTRGWKLNEYGLFDQDEHAIAQKTEEEIYDKLSFEWIPPEQREQLGWMQKYEKHQNQKTETTNNTPKRKKQ